MAVRQVRIYGDPGLRQKALPVETFDDTLRGLAEDMRETMHAYRGIGLAANQIGVLQRMVVIDVPLDGDRRADLALVNPVLSARKGSLTDEEGCLSIPGLYDDVRRAERLHVEAQDLTGQPLAFDAEGHLARVLQHEVDHLDGVLFVDRLSLLKRQFLRKGLDALARGEMPEGYAAPTNSSRGSI
jgi:peptide deformylase